MGLLTVFLTILACLAVAVIADRNVTIDDFDRTRIQYSPPYQWLSVSDPRATLDRYEMTTTYTTSCGAFATFNFSGATAFYFMGYGGVPTAGDFGTIQVQFDGQTYDVPENINPERQGQQILFSQRGLDIKKEYTFMVKKTSADGGGHDLNVDAMIYTVPDAVDRETVPQYGTESHPPVGVIVGVVGTVCAGAFSIMGFWLWLRRRRTQPNPLEAAPYVLPLFASGVIQPLEKNQEMASHDAPPLPSVLNPSQPRLSLTAPSTNPVISNMPIPPQPSNHAPAAMTVVRLQEVSPPPYSG